MSVKVDNQPKVMRVPKIISSAFLLLFTALPAMGNGIKFTEITNANEWEAAFDKAREENKLVFVDAYTDWCTYCHKLDKEVYTESSVIDYFNETFINLKFNAESDFGYQLARYYEIDGYPTLIFLTQSEAVFERIGGFVPAPTLLAYGKRTVERIERLPILEEKNTDLTITDEERLEYISLLETVDPEKASAVAKAHIDSFTSDDYQSLENLWLLSRFENQLNGEPYQYITSHKEQMIEKHGKDEYQDYLKAAYNDNLQLSIKYGDEKLLNQLVTEVLPEFLEGYDLAEGAYVTKKLYYGQRQEFDKYQFAVRQYLNNNVEDFEKENYLFSNALEAIESHEGDALHQFASDLLTELIALNDKHFEGTTLLGYASALLGDFTKAETHLEKAKDLAGTDEQRGMVDNLKDAVSMMKSGDGK